MPSRPGVPNGAGHDDGRRNAYVLGAVSGLIAGTAMSIAMMLVALFRGQSAWTLPNLIAAMWLGPSAATGALGLPTMIGFLTHEATSALMGVIAVPFVSELPRRRVLLVSLAYALASYPLAFSLVMSWANPTMYERVSMIQMTWAHLLFGAVFGVAHTKLTTCDRTSP